MLPRASALLSLLLLVLLVAGCATATPPQPTAVVATPVGAPELPLEVVNNPEERRRTVIWDISSGVVDNPGQWNPFASDARRDKGFHQAMIEPLFILNYESGVIEPWLGERMEPNAAQDVWTLTLREGIRWSDGVPMTAEDVVFTVELLQANPELERDFFAGLLDWIHEMEQVDERTVRFHLTEANPRFQIDFFAVKVWGSFDVLPKHIWHDKDPLTFTNYDPAQGWPVFTGPYLLESFTKRTFTYVRNDEWWGVAAGFKPLPAPERLIWTSINFAAGIEVATQHLDTLGNVRLDEFQQVVANKPNTITWLDGVPFAWMDPCSRTLSFNTLQPPWDQKDLRWAVNAALDRDELVQDAYEGVTIASRYFFPAYPPLERYVQLLEREGLYATYPLTTHAPARARELIEGQGWVLGSDGFYERDGQQLQLTIHAHSASPEMQRMGNLIATQLQDVGINATMLPLEHATWVEHKTNGTFTAMIDWDACGSINEPWASMERYHMRWAKPMGTPAINFNNQVRWSNAAYSELVDQMGALPLGDPQIEPLFVAASAIWLDELPFIPLVQSKELISFDTTYWQNWPTAMNAYVHPPGWWQSVHIILHQLEPVAP
ncbi:MAG: ABC transporter substrate-binding protein [Candidatus Viridilinea halotolerans]|uniref:ABC transporter substrate-binding protein n=1 Tax=Candidatus Viridilinea halotolerans TaxID=2491704 RepID=A0A426TX78_9CHLR|nr:MAG: ABC transporter substrate-binding protein [Candidatus Viridilinea halotolerans]